MYVLSLSSLMHDVINKNAPENLINLFTRVSGIHQYATRSSKSKNLFTKPSRLNIQLNSFSRIGVRLWNSIPGDIRVMSKRSFKKYLSDHLFSTLREWILITILMSPNLYRLSQNWNCQIRNPPCANSFQIQLQIYTYYYHISFLFFSLYHCVYKIVGAV